MQVAVKQHVLFGAAYQLDARLSGMHQGAIRLKIVKRHAARGETCLEPLSDRVAIQLFAFKRVVLFAFPHSLFSRQRWRRA
jgi:hypothetical protein